MAEFYSSYRIGVISDTHGYLNVKVLDLFEGVQMILHAGDIGNEEVLIELGTLAYVCAVSGNVDGYPEPQRRPLTRQLETPAGRIAMTHGHLPQAPTSDKELMIASFHEFKPNIVIFGHSHIPHLSQIDGVTLFNPGSAGRGRFGRGPSVGLITVAEPGAKPVFEHILLD